MPAPRKDSYDFNFRLSTVLHFFAFTLDLFCIYYQFINVIICCGAFSVLGCIKQKLSKNNIWLHARGLGMEKYKLFTAKTILPNSLRFSVSPDNKNPDDARLALFSALFFGLWRVEVYYIFNSVARSSKTQKRPHAFMPCNE